jgi:hypothetical protein
MICQECKTDSDEEFPGVEEPPGWGMGLLSDANAYYACPDCLHTFMAPFRFDRVPITTAK